MPDAPPTSHGSRIAVLAALAANIGVAITKLVGFLLTGSSSLLAETLHSVADSGNQALLLLGAHRAQEPPSAVHPFGRGRERYFWAFVVGLVLFGLGGVFSIVEGTRKVLGASSEIASPLLAMGLILAAMIIEGLSLRTAMREAARVSPTGQSWWRFVRRTRHPEVTVVLLEDGAAMVGLLMALAGVGASWATGNHVWDALASVAIGVLLCAVASLLTIEMKSLLIGETITPEQVSVVVDSINAVEGVTQILNLRTEHLGPDAVLVCVKVGLEDASDLDEVIQIVEAVESAVMIVLPETLTCYVEPDRYDPERVGDAWT